MEPPEAPRRAGATPWLTALALAIAAAVAALVLTGRWVEGGIATALCGAALAAGAVAVTARANPRHAFVHAVAERVCHAVILGAVAWASVREQPLVSAAAVAALSMAYLEAYVRAKAAGLGFGMGPPSVDRYVSLLLVAVGLLVTPTLQAALWLAAGIALLGVARLTFQVSRQEEPS
jgi:hypothetical protein